MTADVIKSVGSAGGRDFSDLAGYVTYVNAIDLVGTDTRQIAELYNDSEFTDTSTLNITSTTDATRYVIIRTATGQSFRDSAGVRTNALLYNVANGVGVKNAIVTHGTEIYYSGIQFTAGFLEQSTGNLHVDSCILTGVYLNGGNLFCKNSLFVENWGNPWIVAWDTSGTGAFDFCTLISLSGVADIFDNTTSGSVTVNDCALFGAAAAATGPVTFTNSMTDATGTTGLIGGKTFANQFVSTTTDFRAKTGADLASAGAPVGGITTDISGFTRDVSTPTIGAWELAPSAAVVVLMGQAVF